MLDNSETFLEIAGTPGPIFVRKIPRKTHWGSDDVDIEERVKFAISHIFREENTFSFYRAESVLDLGRIAIGLNSTRVSLKEQIDFIAFLESELISGDLTISKVPGETKCRYANNLHVDVTASHEQIAHLCRIAMQTKRKASRLSERWIAKRINAAEFELCDAITSFPGRCNCG